MGVQTCSAAWTYYQTPPSSESPVVPACKGSKGEKEKRKEERRDGRKGGRGRGRKGGREGGRCGIS